MYLKRKIDQYLQEWKAGENRKPLIVKGARQIGKTESIREFAKANYSSFIEINFVEEPKYKTIIEEGYAAVDIIKNISRIDPDKKFIPQDTLILFDELQEFPEIATSLKFFCQDGRFDVICSGSLLGISYQRIESNSVGYKNDYLMYSMDFEEFLWAKGYSEAHIKDMLKHMKTGIPFSETEMSVYKKLFLEYCVLGGMPAVVNLYIETNTFSGTLELQKQIQLDYEEDIRKYAEGLDQTKIVSVYRNVPVQLAKENKKFQLSKIDKKARSREYMGCITWLVDAGVITTCYCLSYPELPLKGNYDDSKFKLYYPDTGLLIASLDEEAQEDLRANKNLGVYKGALYENFVAEAFVKQGLGLYYYRKDNGTLEEDFFVRTKDALVPVEVKANNNRSKSLRQLISSDSYGDIYWGIKLADSNIGIEDKICTFPYFCSFLIKRYLNAE